MAFGVFSALYDFKMTPDGDLVIKDGDLELVNGMDWFIQEVTKILRTNNPDWNLHPNVGAGLDDFTGQPNTRAIGKAIENRIYDKITAEHIEFPGKLTVKVVPLTIDSIMVYVLLDVENETIPISKLAYNVQNGIMREIEESTKPVEKPLNVIPNRNPYVTRIR